MKCPKCGYLGFEPVDRCRNCGYEFSLSSPPAVLPELPLRTDSRPMRPLDDLSLVDSASAPPPSVAMADAGPDLARLFGAAAEEPSHAGGRPRSAAPAATPDELPLFGPPIPDGDALITRPSPPRAPLAVRRATPDVARPRGGQPRPQPLDLDLDLDPPPEPVVSHAPVARERAAEPETAVPGGEQFETAAVVTRLVAVAIDLIILAAVDVAVVYFTMQICGLTWADAGVLPKGPLTAFLLVQNGGYLVAFTAGGQTLGKMATGIRVVGTDSPDGTLDLGRAVTRTLVWFALAVPAGLGFLTLLGPDHRGLHDRFAGTRVVRASA